MNGSGLYTPGLPAGRNLRQYGCILNQHGTDALITPLAHINEHPVYEAARRWSQFVRIIPRRQLVGYAVENGRSVLWFRRYALGTGGRPSRVVIAPGAFGIKQGYEYLVGGTGEIAYASTAFVPGDHFIGQVGETDFYVNSGAPVVWEVQTGLLDQPGGADMWAGIVEQVCHTAPRGGFTNEWLIGVQFKPYHTSPSSLWKSSVIADYFPLNDPAGFYAPEIVNDAQLLWHFAYGQGVDGRYGGTLVAEMPTGYRYCPVDVYWSQDYLNQNLTGDPDDWAKFLKSRRIYEPDIEVDSCEAVTEGAMELVKVTMTSRFHSTYGEVDGAPAVFARDVSTWDLDAIQGEPFASVENGITRYLAHQATGRNFLPLIGDNAWNSKVQDLPDNPFGSYYPTFYAVKLLPEPYADDNDTQDPHDTPLWQDVLAMASTYLRVMSERCVDHDQSIAQLLKYITDTGLLPDSWGVHDYREAELYRQAFDGSWIGLMPSEATTETGGAETRQDAPHGHSPPPATAINAEVFNRLSKAVNLLTKFRLMVPYQIRAENWFYYGRRQSAWPDTASFSGTLRAWEDAVDAPRAATLSSGPTSLGVVTDAVAGAECLLTVVEDGGYVLVEASSQPFRWWVEIADGIEAAFPPNVQALLNLENVNVLVQRHVTRSNERRSVVAAAEDGEVMNGSAGWWFGDDGYYVWGAGLVADDSKTVALERPGTVAPPALPASDMAIGRDPSMTNGEFERVGVAQSGLTLSFITGQTLVLEVPLTDL